MINFRRENKIFLIIAIVATIPALVSKYFPAVDSPSHLEIANVLSSLLANPQEDFFSNYFELNPTLIHTNWLFYLLPSLLIKYLPAFVVEKIIVFLYILIFILTGKIISKLYQTQINIAGFLLIPLVYNFPLHTGFYSFLFGLELSFLTIAYYLYFQDKWQFTNSIIFFFLFNLIYLFHPFTFAMTLVILYPYSLYPTLIKYYVTEKFTIKLIPKILKIITQNSNILLYALPGILCLLLTLLDFDAVTSEYERDTFFQLLKILGGFYFLWSYSPLEIIMGMILILFVSILFMIILQKKLKRFPTEKKIEHKDGLILSWLLCLILYFLSPDNFAQGGNLNIRISVYLYFLMVVWLGYQIHQKRFILLIKYFSMSLFTILLIFNAFKSIQISNFIEEYTSVTPYVKENSTIISFNLIEKGLNFDDEVISNRRGIGHVTGYIAVATNSINLGNYQSTRDNFPIKFRSEINPQTLLIAEPPKIIEYNQTQGKIDYVLLWGASYAKNKELLKSIKEELNDNYHLIYTSSKRGLAELYEINS